jgi:accessory gene regulator B
MTRRIDTYSSSQQELDHALLIHGIHILCQDTACILPVLLFACLRGHVFYAVSYIILYALLRVHSGGYHASSHLGCVLLYFVQYLLADFCLEIDLPWTQTLLVLLALWYLFQNVPFLHRLQPLNREEYRKNWKISLVLLSIYCLLYMIASFADLSFANLLFFIIIYTAVLGFMQKHSRNALGNEEIE